MDLTDTKIKGLKAAQKTTKHFDGHGLYLEVTPTGSKLWRLKYRYAGKEKLLSLGRYPEITLKDARFKRDDARRLLAGGTDPSEQRKAEKNAVIGNSKNAFEVIAREWLLTKGVNWADSHKSKIIRRLEQEVFPYLGNRLIESIVPVDLLQVLRRIEARGVHETAHRILGYFGQIFRYAVATARIPSDPSRDLRGALTPVIKQHLAAVTDPKEVGLLLRTLDGHRGSKVVHAALKLAPLVFVRPGELRQARWEDIDLDKAEWRFVLSKTKTQHIVPLSAQAVSVLRELYPHTGHGSYVFPSAKTPTRPMSENAVLVALRTLEIPSEQMCGHGFRAMARTILDEVLGVPPHLIEHQLGHNVKDALGRAYNRTTHLAERRAMMQRWADYLDNLKVEARR
jgi:integrase